MSTCENCEKQKETAKYYNGELCADCLRKLLEENGRKSNRLHEDLIRMEKERDCWRRVAINLSERGKRNE